MRRFLATMVVILALLGIALTIEHLLDANPYNPGFVEHPLAIRLHVILGAVYLGIALPQLVPALRQRRPQLHRSLGRVAIAAGIVAGSTALLITLWFPYSGPLAIVVVGPFAALFVLALARGFWLARCGSYAAHREWMIRAVAIGTSIASMRLIFVPAMLLLGQFEDEALARRLSLVSFGAAFVLHSAVAEWFIRSTREAQREAFPRRSAQHASARASQ